MQSSFRNERTWAYKWNKACTANASTVVSTVKSLSFIFLVSLMLSTGIILGNCGEKEEAK